MARTRCRSISRAVPARYAANAWLLAFLWEYFACVVPAAGSRRWVIYTWRVSMVVVNEQASRFGLGRVMGTPPVVRGGNYLWWGVLQPPLVVYHTIEGDT